MMESIARDVDRLMDQLIDSRRDLHCNPGLSFQEWCTAGVVADRFETLNWKVTRGVAETGVVGLP